MAKDAKEPLLWGSAGNGTGQHMAGELLASMAGVRLRHVPYRGGAQAILDLLGERIDFMVDSPTVMMEHVSAGRLRALAVTGKERFFAFPDVPTLDEVAVRGYETSSWLGLAAPKGVSDKQIADLNKALSDALASPNTAGRLRAVGSVPRPTTPGQFRDRVAADIAKWKQVVEAAQIERI